MAEDRREDAVRWLVSHGAWRRAIAILATIEADDGVVVPGSARGRRPPPRVKVRRVARVRCVDACFFHRVRARVWTCAERTQRGVHNDLVDTWYSAGPRVLDSTSCTLL